MGTCEEKISSFILQPCISNVFGLTVYQRQVFLTKTHLKSYAYRDSWLISQYLEKTCIHLFPLMIHGLALLQSSILLSSVICFFHFAASFLLSSNQSKTITRMLSVKIPVVSCLSAHSTWISPLVKTVNIAFKAWCIYIMAN